MPDHFEPAYLTLHRTGELARRVEQARATLSACRLCGWECGIDRAVETGPCHTGFETPVATAYLHFGEERPLVGRGGSGAVFFSNCDLKCVFCQTARWNIRGEGHVLSAPQLAEVMLDLQRRGAVNINLVTPTHVLPQILEALLMAVENGLGLPLVWNSGGYDAPQALSLLDGIADIYLPDMKYSDELLGARLSGVRDYPAVSRRAVMEMQRQVGDLVVDEDGAARRGVIIRHLVMPGYPSNTGGVLRWIAEAIGPNAYVSLMDQYRPAHRAHGRRDIGRAISPEEFAGAQRLAEQLGLRRLDDSFILDPEETTVE